MPDLLWFPGFEPDSASDMSPADESERQSALDVSRSWIVEAPAGSGKTGLMIQRYLKLLAQESVYDPAQVLAITFTRKATSELRERVLAQLRDAGAGTQPEKPYDALTRPFAEAVLKRDQTYGWDLLGQPRRLNIRTIDSVCAEIAGALPVLSRSGGGAKPSEEPEALYAEAARRTTAMLGGRDMQLHAALTQVLLHRDGSLADCESLIARMLAWRDQWGALVQHAPAKLTDAFLDSEVLPKFQRVLERTICAALSQLDQTLPADFLRQLCELAGEMSNLPGTKGPSPLGPWCNSVTPPECEAEHLDRWLALVHLLLTKKDAFRQKKGITAAFLGFAIEPAHKELLSDLIDQVRGDEKIAAALREIRELPPHLYPAEQWQVTKALIRVLSHALIELQIVFSEHSECDFAELGLLARAALRREEAFDALRIASGHELQHLLVDEMQDTSSSQYELLELLTRGWGDSGQTVFLVGDPKQSIYLFRQARVERFVRTLHQGRLGDVQLGTLRLTANFRSQSKLVEHFNHDFSQIFSASEQGYNPGVITYSAADAVIPSTTAAGRCWHTAIVPSEDASRLTQHQRRQFAGEICEISARWRSNLELDKPASIAVLVRNRTHLLETVEAFKNASPPIPFRAVEVESLAERQEVLDLVALTRALQHTADRTAWLALLRSPFCGLRLADLHRLAGGDDDSLRHATLLDLIDQRAHLLSADGIARLRPFRSAMLNALSLRGKLTLSQWVDQTFRSFNGYQFAGEEARANIAQYLNLLDELEAAGGALEPDHLQARLRKFYAAPSAHAQAVDLMTIHGAKGLEWDVVFVPALERISRRRDSRLLTWLEVEFDGEDSDQEIAQGILAPIQSKGESGSALAKWMSKLEGMREAAERKRLLYVACTRARQELHLFAAPERGKDGVKPASGSLLEAGWPAAMAHFSEASDAKVVAFPSASGPSVLHQLAAAEAPVRTVQRVPLAHMPAVSEAAPEETAAITEYERPEGSFIARAFGNAVHLLLDQCAKILATGTSPDDLLRALPEWQARVAAVLRANGLAAQDVQRQSADVLACLHKTLSEPDGRWILSPHPGAVSEAAMIAWHERRKSLRLDRTFRAGADPGAPGSDFLWIVDFKTSTARGANVQQFLDEHRAMYAPQLEFYASQLAGEGLPVRLALYYPRIARLDWWDPTAR